MPRQRGVREAPPPDRDEPPADPVEVARRICLQLLEHRPRTRVELAAALARRGVPEEAAQEVLGRFEQVGMVDDALFAQLWVSSRHRGRGLAGPALAQELRRKGVADEHAHAALAALGPDQELATARALVQRRLAGSAGLAPPARVRRLVGLLARKGYPAGVAYRVVKEELDREAVEGDGGAVDGAGVDGADVDGADVDGTGVEGLDLAALDPELLDSGVQDRER